MDAKDLQIAERVKPVIVEIKNGDKAHEQQKDEITVYRGGPPTNMRQRYYRLSNGQRIKFDTQRNLPLSLDDAQIHQRAQHLRDDQETGTEVWDDKWYQTKTNPETSILMLAVNVDLPGDEGFVLIKNTPDYWIFLTHPKDSTDHTLFGNTISNGYSNRRKISMRFGGDRVDWDIWNPIAEMASANHIVVSWGF